MFEVLEFSWEELVKETQQKPFDLDGLIGAHDRYLNRIIHKSLLADEALATTLTKILDVVLVFCRAQEALYATAAEEEAKRIQWRQRIYQRETEGKWGIESEDEEEPSFKIPQKMVFQLQANANEYGLLLKAFTTALTKQADENLRFLAFRIDFNEYYEGKERKLPLKLKDSFVLDRDELK